MRLLIPIALLLGTACTPSDTASLVISEVMANNGGSHLDDMDRRSDWIELSNLGTKDASVKGFGLSDDESEPYKWVLPYAVIGPGDQLLVYASNRNRSNPAHALHTNFKLKASGEEILLTAPGGQLVDQINVPPSTKDISWGRDPSRPEEFVFFHQPTPGAQNAASGWPHPLDQAQGEHPLQISEFLVSDGRATIDEDGDTTDWIEVVNRADEPLDLVGFALSDDALEPYKWRFPEVTLAPKDHLVIYASGKDKRPTNGTRLHTGFRLDGKDDVIVLTDPYGQAIDGISTAQARPGISIGRPGDDPGLWLHFPTPTPGMPNTTRGFDGELSHTEVHPTGLQINEVVAQHTRSSVGDRPDWIELKNGSDKTIELGGIGLSDDPTEPFAWTLPSGTLEPGELMVLDLVGDGCGSEPCPEGQVPMGIDPGGERLTLTHPSGRVLDVFHTGRLKPRVSSGRRTETGAQRLFFLQQTRGEENTARAFSGYATPPIFLTQGGPSPDTVVVKFATPAPGTVIRYSRDGGTPHRGSSIATEPITLSRSKTIRARAFRADRLPSPTVTRTFLTGKSHELVTLALTVKRRHMFELKEGLYMSGEAASSEYPHKGANFWSEKELPGHLELYEPDGKLGLDMKVGLKIFGAFSRGMAKKSLQLVARNVYGPDRIRYPLFADKGLTDVHRIVLRQSGQDAFKSHFRDVLMSSLVSETGIDYQAHRQAVLYINGKYWGLYNIREKIHTDFLADNHGVNPDRIDLLVANGRAQRGSSRDYDKLMDVARSRGFTEDETYQWACTQMDVKNFADYQFFQMFFGNTDNGNIRFWRERGPEGRWRWILYDLDTGFSFVDLDGVSHVTHPNGTGAKRRFSTVLLRRLLENPDFKDLFLKRASHHLRNTFESSRVKQRIDALATAVDDEIDDENRRWIVRDGKWKSEVAKMHRFAEKRPNKIREQLIAHFELSDEAIERYSLGISETLP